MNSIEGLTDLIATQVKKIDELTAALEYAQGRIGGLLLEKQKAETRAFDLTQQLEKQAKQFALQRISDFGQVQDAPVAAAARPPADAAPVDAALGLLREVMKTKTVVERADLYSRIESFIAQPSPVQAEPLSQPAAAGNWPKDFHDVIKGAEEAARQQGRVAGLEEAIERIDKAVVYLGTNGERDLKEFYLSCLRDLNKTGAA